MMLTLDYHHFVEAADDDEAVVDSNCDLLYTFSSFNSSKSSSRESKKNFDYFLSLADI